MGIDYFDNLEVRDPQARELAQFNLLPDMLRRAMQLAPGWARQLEGVDPAEIITRQALSQLPILRKAELCERQARHPPFGGFATDNAAAMSRVFMSPGPFFEPEGAARDWWRSARALHAAGFRKGDIVLNTFAYHLTPGGWIIDAGARALGCMIIPAGPGKIEQQIEAITRLRPTAFAGVPDLIGLVLETAREKGADVSSLKHAFFSGAPLQPQQRAFLRQCGIAGFQAYATADVGLIAYETDPPDAMIVDEGVIVEIVEPVTGAPLPPGEIGEVIVTSFNRDYPMIRLATGDLSAIVPGQSPCGRTNMRISGWLGHADQTVHIHNKPLGQQHLGELARAMPELGRLRAVIESSHEGEIVILKAEAGSQDWGLVARVQEAFARLTQITCKVELLPPGALPNDGRSVIDERE
jgi:phenylacetate-CoA ligase